MELRIKNEIKKRISILEEQGMMTDLDVLGLTLEGDFCISNATNVYGQIVGVINTVDANSYTNDIWNKAIKEISYYGATPYLGMFMNSNFGEMMTVLYISKDEEQWAIQCDELKNKDTCAFVYNVTNKHAEFGYITYEMFNGGPIRTS